MKTKQVFIIALLASSTMVACKKDKNSGPSREDQQKAVDVFSGHEAAVTPFSETFNISLEQNHELIASMARTGDVSDILTRKVQGQDAHCYETTISPGGYAQWPKTVTRNFGDGCKGADGKLRKGKIISVFSSPFIFAGAEVTTSFDGYEVDGVKLTGRLKTKFESSNGSDTVYSLTVDYMDAQALHAASGFWTKLNGSVKHTLDKVVPNYFSPTTPFRTTGNVSGENSLGLKWSAEVKTPILRSVSCQWPLSGVLLLKWNDNAESVSVDYGNGVCDNKAVVDYKGHKTTINL